MPLSSSFASRTFLCAAILTLLFLFSSGLNAQTCLTTNIAAGKTVVTNLEETYSPGSNITDGNMSTTWLSGADGAKWAYVDLGQGYTVCKVIVKLDYGHPVPAAKIQGSNTAANDWVDLKVLATDDYGLPGENNTYTYHDIDLSASTTSYRYIRIYIPVSGPFEPKMKEFEVYPKGIPLTVSLTSPATGTSYVQGSTITLSADASGGTISKVEFYEGSNKLGEDLGAPYQFTWNGAAVGDYTVVAKAIDASNQTAVSSPIDIHVLAPSSAWSLSGNVGNATTNFLGTTDNKPLIVKTNGVERLRLTETGDLGLGTNDTKGYKLAVNGDAIFTRIKVKTYSSWADYVFHPDYKLPSLKEVEEFIRKNHHLQGVPSAERVEKEGLDLTDNQATLLKKIEELTLYIIELNKEVEKLKKQNPGGQKSLKQKK